MQDEPRKLLDRRQALGALGVLGLGAIAAACSSDKSSSSAGTTTTSGSSASNGASASGSAACTLTPETTEGPFYVDLDDVRGDITEGRAGTPLSLQISVVDASSCTPIKDAAVDIWHCDAGGVYSGVEQSTGTTFLRGTQISDDKGAVTFDTIYPGWYQGRTVHIHTKVRVNNNDVHTGQVFFDDSLTDTVFDQNPYNTRGDRDTRNDDDSIFRDAGGSSAIVPLNPGGSGYTGQITLGVKQS